MKGHRTGKEHSQILNVGANIAKKIAAMRWEAYHPNPTQGRDQTEFSHKVIGKGTAANAGDIARYGRAPTEVRHALIDYRNGNEKLAFKMMDRKKAYHLNARLKDTGFAWAAMTGY